MVRKTGIIIDSIPEDPRPTENASVRKVRRVKLKQLKYALRSTPIVLTSHSRDDPFEYLCGIGIVIPKKYEEWFVEGINPGTRFLENVKQDIDVLIVNISEK